MKTVQIKTIKVSGRNLNIKMFKQLEEFSLDELLEDYGLGATVKGHVVKVNAFIKKEVVGVVRYCIRGEQSGIWFVGQRNKCLYRTSLYVETWRHYREFLRGICQDIQRECPQIFL